jgi:serine/threonine protein kinase/lipoprotein NlpI
MTDGLPYILGHYSLIEHLGGGTFGTVFKAREQGSETDHALKVLRPGISNIRPEEVERFRSEAKRHDALDNHVNIARFESLLTISCRQVSSTVLSLIDLSLPQSIAQRSAVDEPLMEVNGLRCVKAVPHPVGNCTEGEFALDEDSSLVVVRMKYYPDGDLRERFRQSLSQEDALKIGLGIVRGLTHMHLNDLVHRDLKPSNILIDSRSATIEDSPKITDFGIARTMSLGDSTYAAGTNGWAAPEQFKSDHTGKIPPTLDIYAVGQVLFKMLTGVAPFSLEGLRRPEPVRELDSSITGPVAEIVDRCRETDHLDRYQSMAEVVEALETAMDSGARSRPAGALRGSPQLEPAYDDASRVIGGVLTSNLADEIRQFVLENHIEPGREQGRERVDVRAGDVAAGMGLRNRMPSVCNAMTGKKIEALAGVQIGAIRGPNPGANCVVDYLVSGAMSKPEDHLDESLDFEPRDEVPDADRFYNDGLHHLNRDSYQAAIVAFGMAVKNDQNHSDAYTNRGVAYLELGNYQAAYDDFTRAISIRDDDALPFFNRGLACVEMGDDDGALSDYGKAIELDPNDANFWYSRGLLYVDLEDWGDALNDFYEALAVEPGHDGALQMIELESDSSDEEEDDDEDENVWEDVATIAGYFYSSHSDVTRYRFVHANRRFDLYLPNLLLDAFIGEDPPRNLEVMLRGEEAGHPSPSRPGPEDPDWRYVSFQEHGSSVQYRVHAPNHTGTRDINYKIYVPKTVFGGKDYPENIWVSVGPADPSLT